MCFEGDSSGRWAEDDVLCVWHSSAKHLSQNWLEKSRDGQQEQKVSESLLVWNIKVIHGVAR